MFSALLVIFSVLLIPSDAFAWGPLTHIYLGSEVLYFGALLPSTVFGLIRKYRQDFLYGNLMADTILAKRYLPAKKNSHSWSVAQGMLDSAETSYEKAFCLGYMSHLAADTVAHGTYTAGRRNLEHAYLEFKADSVIGSSYRLQAVAINRRVQARNDSFLEKSLDNVFLSFGANRKIFKGFVALSMLNKTGFGNQRRGKIIRKGEGADLGVLHRESLDRIVDVLNNGERSEVLKRNPMDNYKKRRLFGPYLI
jgi:hypothetical protein